jgi:hypothetical protein
MCSVPFKYGTPITRADGGDYFTLPQHAFAPGLCTDIAPVQYLVASSAKCIRRANADVCRRDAAMLNTLAVGCLLCAMHT